MNGIIYQVHRKGGYYEDSYDYIEGTFISEANAKVCRLGLELDYKDRVSRAEKCDECFMETDLFEYKPERECYEQSSEADYPCCNNYVSMPFDDNVIFTIEKIELVDWESEVGSLVGEYLCSHTL